MRFASPRGHQAALLLVCLSSLVTTACAAGSARYVSAPAMAAAPGAPPQPLDHSVFAKDPEGVLSEENLQTVLDSPIELDLPARVGVLPIVTAKDWRGPGPDYQRVPAGVGLFVKGLRGAEAFTLVTEVMPIPNGALGMEALRNVAARYRLRYIVLYREVTFDRTRANGIAWAYATILGALFLPGETLTVQGYMEASLFDVKTGLLLFTVRRDMGARKDSNVWHQADKLEDLAAGLARDVAPRLASDFRAGMHQFADAVKTEHEQRASRGPISAPNRPAEVATPGDRANTSAIGTD